MGSVAAQTLLRDLQLGVSFERANLAGLQLEGAVIPKANLVRADLSGANLAGVDLRGADLSSANLREAHLAGAQLDGAKLRHADLEGADLAGAGLVGADLAAANLEGASLEKATLKDARLERAVLIDANLGKADLAGAKLRNADLNDAYLGGAVLRGADLARANLQAANLEEADLTDADLRESHLGSATLAGAVLDGARVFGLVVTVAQLATTRTSWVDVSRAGDRSQREDGTAVGGFLAAAASSTLAAAPLPPAVPRVLEPSTRFFGPGDTLRKAELAFAPGCTVVVDGTFDQCRLTLGDDTELTVGPSGVLRNCQILGLGRVVVKGQLASDGDGAQTTARVLVVAAGGHAAGIVRQPEGGTRFGFEAGAVMRLKVVR